MNLMKTLMIAATLTLLTSVAGAATPLFVACYIDNGVLSVSVDPDLKSLTVETNQNGQPEDLFMSLPNSDWAKQLSTVTYDWSNPRHVTLKAHIIGGDREMPLIDATAEMALDEINGEFHVSSAFLYHNGITYNLNAFVNQSCYVRN